MAKNSIYGSNAPIILDSTDAASMRLYPNNRPSHFRNVMSTELKLVGPNWEVGMVWARIPFTWRNVPNAIQFGLIYIPKMGHKSRSDFSTDDDPMTARLHAIDNGTLNQYPLNASNYQVYYLSPGFFPTRYALGVHMEGEINTLLLGTGMSVHFYEKPDKTFGFRVKGGKLSIWTNNIGFLTNTFGFLTHSLKPDNAPFKVEGIMDLEKAISVKDKIKPFQAYQSIEVYCSAVAPYRMGSSLVHLLAPIPTNDVINGTTFVYRPNPMFYYPVSANSFTEFEVQLANRTDVEVKFCGDDADQVTLQLHFRQKPYSI